MLEVRNIFKKIPFKYCMWEKIKSKNQCPRGSTVKLAIWWVILKQKNKNLWTRWRDKHVGVAIS